MTLKRCSPPTTPSPPPTPVRHTFWRRTLFKDRGRLVAVSSTPKDIATGVNSLSGPILRDAAGARQSESDPRWQAPFTAGTLAGVIVTAVDIYGNRATSYHGEPSTSAALTRRRACRPTIPSRPRTAASHTFLVTLKTAGTQSFSVADTTNAPVLQHADGHVVVPAAAVRVRLYGPARRLDGGTPQTFTITAMDAFGNRAPFLARSSSRAVTAQASLPCRLRRSPRPTPAATRSTAVLKTAGPQTITVNDAFAGTPTGPQSVTVTPGRSFIVQRSGFPATTAGVAHSFTG